MSTEHPHIMSAENIEGIVITRASTENAVAIPKIQKDGWLTTYVNNEHGITEADILERDFDSDKKVNQWAEAINKPGRATFVAKEKGVTIGFCFVKEDDESNQIGALYVLSSARGKGIGTKLLEQGIAYLGGEKMISLEVVAYNANAIAFYESFGFTSVGAIENQTSGILPSGKHIPEIKMVLYPATGVSD